MPLSMSNNDLEVARNFDQVKFDLIVEFSEGQLHDQVTSAIEGGVTGCWALVNVGPHQPGWRNYFTAEFTDVEDKNRKHKLSIDKLKRGLLVLREKYPRHFADIITESGDAETGDALVQCALFGDIVYG